MGKVSIFTKGCIELKNNQFVVIDTIVYQPGNKHHISILINSPYVFTNLLPCAINLFFDKEKVAEIGSKDLFCLTQKNFSNYSVCLELLLSTSVFTTDCYLAETEKLKIKEKDHWAIFSFVKKTNLQCIEVSFYSQYLIVNSTDFCISIEKFIIGPAQLGFFYSKKDAVKIRIKDFETA